MLPYSKGITFAKVLLLFVLVLWVSHVKAAKDGRMIYAGFSEADPGPSASLRPSDVGPVRITLDNQTFEDTIVVSFSRPVILKHIVFNYSRDDYSVGEKTESVLQIRHVKGEYLEVTRCLRLTQDEMKKGELSRKIDQLSVFDEFGPIFEEQFAKRSASMNFVGTERNWPYATPLPGHYECNVLKIFGDEYSQATSLLSSIATPLGAYIDKVFFTENIQNYLSAESNSFWVKVYFTKEGDVTKLIYDLNNISRRIPSLRLISSSYLQQQGCALIVYQLKPSKASSYHIYYGMIDPQTRGFAIGKDTIDMQEYDANATLKKRVVGNGLHQEVKISLSLVANQSYFFRRVQRNGCQFVIWDILGEDVFIDSEDFTRLGSAGLIRFAKEIDIEKPSFASKQVQVMFANHLDVGKFAPHEKVFDFVKIDYEFSYPLHFRYSDPTNETTTKVKVGRHPRVFLDCFDPRFGKRPLVLDLFENMAENIMQTSPLELTVKYDDEGKSYDEIEVPTGQSQHGDLVQTITLALSLGISIILAAVLATVPLR